LRGRGARGLQKSGAPKSVANKLLLALVTYAVVGCVAFSFLGQPTFVLSVYLHAMTFVFLGMFVAASSGEVLFNKEEADILMHRPITARQLLWAKIAVLVRVSLWLAGAFNLAGLFVGVAVPGEAGCIHWRMYFPARCRRCSAWGPWWWFINFACAGAGANVSMV